MLDDSAGTNKNYIVLKQILDFFPFWWANSIVTSISLHCTAAAIYFGIGHAVNAVLAVAVLYDDDMKKISQ